MARIIPKNENASQLDLASSVHGLLSMQSCYYITHILAPCLVYLPTIVAFVTGGGASTSILALAMYLISLGLSLLA